MKHALWLVIFQCKLSFVRYFLAQLSSFWSRLPTLDDCPFPCSGQRESRKQLSPTPSTHHAPLSIWRECYPRCPTEIWRTGKLTIFTNPFPSRPFPTTLPGWISIFNWSL